MVGQVVGGPFGWNLSNKKAITKVDKASKEFAVKCRNLAQGNWDETEFYRGKLLQGNFV